MGGSFTGLAGAKSAAQGNGSKMCNSVGIASCPCGGLGKMGRRSQTDEGERRTATLTVQLTPSERADLGTRAEAGGVKLSDFARAALLGYHLPAPRHPLTERAVSELCAIGNNLNQLARVANTTGQIEAHALAEALTIWRDVVARLHQ